CAVRARWFSSGSAGGFDAGERGLVACGTGGDGLFGGGAQLGAALLDGVGRGEDPVRLGRGGAGLLVGLVDTIHGRACLFVMVEVGLAPTGRVRAPVGADLLVNSGGLLSTDCTGYPVHWQRGLPTEGTGHGEGGAARARRSCRSRRDRRPEGARARCREGAQGVAGAQQGAEGSSAASRAGAAGARGR